MFDRTLWTIEPTAGIDQLYQQRARDLRERYDYITLMYSAGIDSHTVLHAFLAQGLRVDELVVSWPVKLADRYGRNPDDHSASNYISEWTYLIEPQLQWLTKHHPDIRITVIDSSERIVKNVYTENDFFGFENYYGIASMNRWPQFAEKLRDISGQHSNSVVLSGLDKPQLAVRNGGLYTYFVDTLIHLKSTDEVNMEYFYWSPDATEILRKQCHMIYRYFLQNPDQQVQLQTRNDTLLRTINQCIYPIYDAERFQTGKQIFVLYNEQYSFLYDLSEHDTTRIMQDWTAQWNSLNNVIDPRYQRLTAGKFDGFVGFVTPFYHIGNF